jgi:hypothetical protein
MVVSCDLSVVVKTRATCAIIIVQTWLGALLAVSRCCSGGIYALHPGDGTYTLAVAELEEIHGGLYVAAGESMSPIVSCGLKRVSKLWPEIRREKGYMSG